MGLRLYVAVVGPADASDEVEQQAEAVGAALPVVGLGTWDIAGVDVAAWPEAAARQAVAAARKRTMRP